MEQFEDYDLSNLQFNTKLKYSELCEMFNMERERGSKLQKQIRTLEKDFEIYKKDKYYIIIKKLTEKEKLEKLYYNNIKSHIEMLICTLLTYPIIERNKKFDMPDLLQVLSIVNNDYKSTKYNKEYATMLLELEDLEYNNINIFFNETEPLLRRIVIESLNNLEDKQILLVKRHTVLVKNEYDEKGRIIKSIPHELENDEEEEAFIICKNEVLKEMGFTKESQVFASGNYIKKRYRDKVSMKLGHDYYYTRYELIINTKHIMEYTIQDPIEKRKIEKICNQLVKKKIMSSKQGELKLLSDNYRKIYVDNFIDIEVDNNFREKYKELRKLEGE